MIKKIIFAVFAILVLISGEIYSYEYKSVAAATASVAMAGTGIYWMQREPNSEKIGRVYQAQSYYAVKIVPLVKELDRIQDPDIFMEKMLESDPEFSSFTQMITQAYQEISARYDSWFKPWNHTKKMKNAFDVVSHVRQQWNTDLVLIQSKKKVMHAKKMVMLERLETQNLMVYFTKVMTGFKSFENDIAMEKFALKICKGNSIYPIHAAVEIIRLAINLFHVHHSFIAYDQDVIDAMTLASEEMLSSYKYIQETKDRIEQELKQEEIALQQRLLLVEEEKNRTAKAQVAALQEQAHALFAQALAQERQAQAQKEHNQIDKERNRIERDKDRY